MGTANASGLSPMYRGMNDLGALSPPRESWQASSSEMASMNRANTLNTMNDQANLYAEQQQFTNVMQRLGLSESLISTTLSPYAARAVSVESGIGMRHFDNPTTRRKAYNNLTLMRGKK